MARRGPNRISMFAVWAVWASEVYTPANISSLMRGLGSLAARQSKPRRDPEEWLRVLCEMILSDRPHPEQGYRSCLGIVRLARPYGAARVDAASAARARDRARANMGAVKSILEKKLDGERLHRPRTAGEVGIDHPNIRGPKYYH